MPTDSESSEDSTATVTESKKEDTVKTSSKSTETTTSDDFVGNPQVNNTMANNEVCRVSIKPPVFLKNDPSLYFL